MTKLCATRPTSRLDLRKVLTGFPSLQIGKRPLRTLINALSQGCPACQRFLIQGRPSPLRNFWSTQNFSGGRMRAREGLRSTAVDLRSLVRPVRHFAGHQKTSGLAKAACHASPPSQNPVDGSHSLRCLRSTGYRRGGTEAGDAAERRPLRIPSH